MLHVVRSTEGGDSNPTLLAACADGCTHLLRLPLSEVFDFDDRAATPTALHVSDPPALRCVPSVARGEAFCWCS